jgi:hypothetical protein
MLPPVRISVDVCYLDEFSPQPPAIFFKEIETSIEVLFPISTVMFDIRIILNRSHMDQDLGRALR